MDSGSGKNRNESDDNQAKEPPPTSRPREESKDATAAATAAAPEPPAPAPPSERLQERTNGSHEAGGGRNSSAAAVAAGEAAPATQRSGTGIAGPFPRGSASVKPQLPPIAAYISRPESLRLRQPQGPQPKPTGGKPPLPPRAVPASRSKSRGEKRMPHAELVESGMVVRAKWRKMQDGRRDELKEESKAAMPERTATQHENQFLDRVGISDARIKKSDVDYETIPSSGIQRYYNLLELVAGGEVEFSANALNLQRVYSGLRPVLGDGECFYRSFIFNYLEQVLDRQDIHEERRLLVAAEEVASQHARLGWVDKFSRSHREFKKLVEKVMRWKTNRWNVPTANSYRKMKLLKYFNSYHGRNNIYAFLRFVAAIWMCSHSEEFTPLVMPELEEGGYTTLTDWCRVEVIQKKIMTDHIQITALIRALGLRLRVENLLQGFGEDLHNVQVSQDEVPRMTLLYMNNHYDIIYPDSDASLSQDSDKVESPPAKSPSQDRGSNDCRDPSSTCGERIVDWLSIPPGVIWQISTCLDDDSERIKMRLVSKEWHMELPAVIAQRPWVIGSRMTNGIFHSIHGKELYQLQFKCKIPDGFFYSSSGSFILMQAGARHSLWSPTNRMSFKLPLKTYKKIVMPTAISAFAFCNNEAVHLSYGIPSDETSWKQIFCLDRGITDICQCENQCYAVNRMFRLYRLDEKKNRLELIGPEQTLDDILKSMTVPKIPDHIFLADLNGELVVVSVGRKLGSVDLFKVVWVSDRMTRLVMVSDFGTWSLFLGRNQAIALSPAKFPGIQPSSLYLALEPVTDDTEATVVVYDLQTRSAVDTCYNLQNLGDPFFYHPDAVGTASALFE
ncbi:unnamed protein product [Urochloa humidicola]